MKEHRPTSDTAPIPEKERPSMKEGRSDVCIMRGFMSADAARHTHVLASLAGNGDLVRGPKEVRHRGYCSAFGRVGGVDMNVIATKSLMTRILKALRLAACSYKKIPALSFAEIKTQTSFLFLF